MNLSKYRNSYLIDKTYRLTLVSMTLTALAPLIATLVDGLFSSNLLGNDAFISVSVALPLVNAVSVLTMICERGGSVLAAGQLAKGNRERANSIYTASLASAVLVAVIVAVGVWINIDSIALGLTGSPESAVYAREYLQIIVIYLFILPLNNTFNDFATQEGFPQLTTRAVTTGSIANVVLDIFFIGVLEMGISGAAWGTVISGLINLALISPYFLKGKSQCRLARPQSDLGAILGENLKHGFGFNVFFIVVNAFMLLGNALVLNVAGYDGLTLFDVCLQIQSATFSVVVGLCLAGIPHINYLRASGDSAGLQRIMKNTARIVVGFYGLLLLLLVTVPQLFLWCFGLEGSIDPALARWVFTCFGIYYFCFCVVSVYVTVVLQLAGHVAAKILLVFSMGILAYLSMLGLSKVSADAMWLGMIVGGVPILVASLAYGYWEHRKHPFYTMFSLVDKMLTCIKFECSIDYEQHNLEEMKQMMKLFANTCEMNDEVRSKMHDTIRVHINNAEERRSNELKYLDISLTELDDGFQMTIKDCGRPYNPVHNGMDAASLGARSATYRYMFTMNVTTIVWNKI
jgi:Na+-driven multidrug efflux pump